MGAGPAGGKIIGLGYFAVDTVVIVLYLHVADDARRVPYRSR